MQDDERLTSLNVDGELTDRGESASDRRMQLFAFAVLLGACLLWVAGRAVLHRTVAAPSPVVSTLARGVLTTSAESSRTPQVLTGATTEQQSNLTALISADMLQQGNTGVKGDARLRGSDEVASRQLMHRSGLVAPDSSTQLSPPSCGSAQSRLSLNDATASQLDALPGVGPVLAQRIITWRVAHKGFSDVHELQEVPGIGPSKFARMRGLVHVR
ncbi:MAG: helix-hairpin-helix domain-containing protein [Actinobacteria bacterium]|nr:helix-hairpin-helix domain-containing protein [Actinomycetota bacterium]